MNHVTWDSLVADVCFLLESFLELGDLVEDVWRASSHGVAFGDADSAARLLGHEELESHQVRPLNHPEHAQVETNRNLKY